jgi:hypothetical protein
MLMRHKSYGVILARRRISAPLLGRAAVEQRASSRPMPEDAPVIRTVSAAMSCPFYRIVTIPYINHRAKKDRTDVER